MQLVAIRSAVFYIVCGFIMFLVDAISAQIVEAYSSIGLVAALYIKSNVSLCLLHFVEERSWYSFRCIGCYVNVFVVSNLGSRVKPNILVCV